MRHKVKRIHFVGIGGSGMSGIAEVLANLGYTVTGSDLAEGAAVRRLRGLGIRIVIGHAAQNVEAADAVVVSSAVQRRQPRGAARARGAHSGGAARDDAGGAHALQAGHRHRRHPRQDHDHLAGGRACWARRGSIPPA